MPKVATLIFNLDNSDANGTTYDATVAGLGDVTGFYYNFAAQDLDASENLDRYEHAGCGGIDSGSAFDCYSISTFDENGVTTSDSDRSQRYSGDANIYFLGTMQVSVSRITDGLRLTKVANITAPSGGAATREIQLCIHAVSGCKVSVGTGVLPNNSTVSATTNASDGTGNIDCNTAFIFSANTNLTNGIGELGLPTYGFAQRVTDSSFRQWSQSWNSRNGQGTSEVNTLFRNNCVMAQISQGTVDWTAAVTSWTANGSTSAITWTTTGSANSDRFAYIAFEDTLAAYVDTESVDPFTSSPFSLTGSTATGVYPKHLHIGGTSAATINSIDTGQTASTCQFYWRSDRTSDSSIAQNNNYGFSADGVGTMVARSKNANSTGPQITYYSGSEQTLLTGTTAFSSGSQDASFTVNQIDFSSTVSFGYFLVSDDWSDGLIAQLGTFALTGKDATLSIVVKLEADAGSFYLSGQQASLKTTAATSTASFSVTGNAISAVQKIGADVGTFSLTAPSIATETRLVTAAGSFALTGVNAGLFVFSGIRAQVASFALTGIDSTLRIKHVVDAGVFNLTGSAADLQAGETLDAVAGSFNVSGGDSKFQVTFAALVGSLQLTGRPVGLIDTGNLVSSPYYYRFMMQDE